MEAYELAQQIQSSELQTSPENIDRVGLAELIEECRPIYRKLEELQYDRNEHGFLSIGFTDSSDYDYPGIIIGDVIVSFTDPTGYRTKLGKISRSKKSHYTGVAEAFVAENQTEPIYPGDERWDVVVGTIGRAIQQCKGDSDA